jgi:hypothetical protein
LIKVEDNQITLINQNNYDDYSPEQITLTLSGNKDKLSVSTTTFKRWNQQINKDEDVTLKDDEEKEVTKLEIWLNSDENDIDLNIEYDNDRNNYAYVYIQSLPEEDIKILKEFYTEKILKNRRTLGFEDPILNADKSNENENELKKIFQFIEYTYNNNFTPNNKLFLGEGVVAVSNPPPTTPQAPAAGAVTSAVVSAAEEAAAESGPLTVYGNKSESNPYISPALATNKETEELKKEEEEAPAETKTTAAATTATTAAADSSKLAILF